MNKDHDLLDYARFKGYKHPEAWVEKLRQQERYAKQFEANDEAAAEAFYYYFHPESDSVWKQRKEITDKKTLAEVSDLYEAEYFEMLKALGEDDGLDKIYDL